jgi:hypothetical protein
MPNKALHVSEALAEVFKRAGMKRGVKRAEAVLLWPQVVGTEVAKFSQAKSLREGILWVEVPDSETSMYLTLQRDKFIDVYRARFKVREIKDIRFRVGRPQVESTPTPQPTTKVDGKALSELARKLGQLELPEGLAGVTMQAAKAMLAYRARKLADGWVACQLCGILTETPEMCPTCQRYASDLKVRRAAQILTVSPQEPTPLLSDEERLVSRHLAKTSLGNTLLELLPHALADQSVRPQLEHAARCFLSLTLGKTVDEINEEDYSLLDMPVARALGYWSTP